MKRVFALILLLASSFYVTAQSPQSADEVLAEAEKQASEQHKNILLVFGASWCKYCHQFDKFRAAPQISPILQKNFVTAELSVDEEAGKKPELNSPGGEQLLAKLGGDVNGGIPFIVFLDANGNMIVNSLREGKKDENIGYPVAPEEVDWFMVMLKNSVTSLSGDEAQTVEKWLRPGGHS